MIAARSGGQLAALGFAAATAQSVLLREAMAALDGSELAWGAVLALWLAGTGLGAALAGSPSEPGAGRPTASSAGLACWLPTVMIATSALGVMGLRAAPAILGTAAGEPWSLGAGAWLWMLAILPAAAAGGLAFPLLARTARPTSPGVAYAQEGAGALAGGLAFTFVLAPLGSLTTLGAALGVGALCAARRPLVVALAVALAGAGAGRALERPLAELSWTWSGRPGGLLVALESRRQRLELSDGPPFSLYADGRLVASVPDPWQVAPSAHLALLLHPDPRRVLVVGGLADGALEVMLRHPVEALEAVESDPALTRLLLDRVAPHCPLGPPDPRLTIVAADPVPAIRSRRNLDLIVLRDGDPVTLRAHRTRSLEFFHACRDALAPDGLLLVPVGVPDTYLGGLGGELLATTVATAAAAFPRLALVPGERVLVVAGGPGAELTLEPGRLAERWRRRGVDDPRFRPEMLPLLLDPQRAASLEHWRLGVSAPPSTAVRPRAMVLAAGLVSGRGLGAATTLARSLLGIDGRLTAGLLALVLAATLAVARRRGPGALPAFAIGAASMGWWLILVAAWQAGQGAAFSAIGAFTGLFMGGLAAGAAWASRWRSPQARLPVVLAVGAAASLALAAVVTAGWPAWLTPAGLAACGVITGCAFPGAAAVAGAGRPTSGLARAFAADELGAACGALVVGLAALPAAGSAATAVALAALLATAALAAR